MSSKHDHIGARTVTDASSGKKVKTGPLPTTDFNVLFADYKKCFPSFLLEYEDKLAHVRLVIFERDHATTIDYNIVDKILKRNGFTLVKSALQFILNEIVRRGSVQLRQTYFRIRIAAQVQSEASTNRHCEGAGANIPVPSIPSFFPHTAVALTPARAVVIVPRTGPGPRSTSPPCRRCPVLIPLRNMVRWRNDRATKPHTRRPVPPRRRPFRLALPCTRSRVALPPPDCRSQLRVTVSVAAFVCDYEGWPAAEQGYDPYHAPSSLHAVRRLGATRVVGVETETSHLGL